MHARADLGSLGADMGLSERGVMGLTSQAISAQVTKHFF